MVLKGASSYLIRKLIFPKKLIIDKPGLIYDLVTRRYGFGDNKKRILWYFEEIFVNLQLETIKKIGKKETSILFYKIGKDIGTRNILFFNKKSFPSFLISPFLNYLFDVFKASGMSVCEKRKYSVKEKFVILRGRDNILCRKSGEGNLFAGVISATLSFIFNENLEAEKTRCCKEDNFCEIVCNSKIPFKYKPSLELLFPLKDYFKLNFPNKCFSREKFSSFKDYIKFKKIIIDKENKTFFLGNSLVPCEVGLIGIVCDNYIKHGLNKVLEKGLIEGAEKLFKKIFEEDSSLKSNEKKFLDLFSVLGNGLPYLRKNKTSLSISFFNPPFTKYGFLYQSLVLNGFLNKLYGKKFEIKEINTLPEKLLIEVLYSEL